MTVRATSIGTAGPGTPLHHHWNLRVCAGRAAEGPRAGWLEHLRLLVTQCGFSYVRFHGLFHDDLFVWHRIGDRVEYNGGTSTRSSIACKTQGPKPFVELGFCPRELATVEGTASWWKGNGSPPKDEAA